MKEKSIADALPGFVIGTQTIVYAAFQHYYNGMSISKIIKTLKIQGLEVSEATLVGGWHALAKLFKPFYDEIGETIKNFTGAVHADETSHRQKGKKYWLWSFSTKTEAFFSIRKRRNGEVVISILGKSFPGILVTDFWKPYLATSARFRQWCVAHFLREFKKIEFKESRPPPEYYKFKKKVKRLFGDALRFSKKKVTKKERKKAHRRFLKRLDDIVSTGSEYNDPDVKRLIKRLKTYRDGFFTFVALEGVDATNNHAERTIRFAVIMRKVFFHTMSEKGSDTMSILMSIFKTFDLRGEDVYEKTLELAKQAIIEQKKSDLAA